MPGTDSRGSIAACSGPACRTERTVADIGCGVGRALHLFTPRFGRVYATDLSRECLAIAEKEHAGWAGAVHPCRPDTHPWPSGTGRWAVCINTPFTPPWRRRGHVAEPLRCREARRPPAGRGPLLESALYASHCLVRLNRRSGYSPRDVQRKAREGHVRPGPHVVGGRRAHQAPPERGAARCAEGEGCRCRNRKLEYPWRLLQWIRPSDMETAGPVN